MQDNNHKNPDVIKLRNEYKKKFGQNALVIKTVKFITDGDTIIVPSMHYLNALEIKQIKTQEEIEKIKKEYFIKFKNLETKLLSI